MLQELAADSGATVWPIVSMLFFLAIWLGIAAWVCRIRPEELEARSRLALADDEDHQSEIPSGAGTQA